MSQPPTQDPSADFTQQGMRRPAMAGLVPSIALNAVAPYLLYQYLTGHNVSTIAALSATAVFPLIGIAYGWVRTKHLDALGIATLVLIVIGLLTNLLFQDPKIFLIKESFVTGALGLACLLSLVVLRRPAMFYLGRYFASGGNAEAAQRYEALWQYPSFRHAQRLMTAVWGVVYVCEALLRVALVQVIGTSKAGVAEILAISPVLLGAVTLLTVAWTMWYVRYSSRKGAELRAARLAAQRAR